MWDKMSPLSGGMEWWSSGRMGDALRDAAWFGRWRSFYCSYVQALGDGKSFKIFEIFGSDGPEKNRGVERRLEFIHVGIGCE